MPICGFVCSPRLLAKPLKAGIQRLRKHLIWLFIQLPVEAGIVVGVHPRLKVLVSTDLSKKRAAISDWRSLCDEMMRMNADRKAQILRLYFYLQRATARHRSDVNTAQIPSTLQFNAGRSI